MKPLDLIARKALSHGGKSWTPLVSAYGWIERRRGALGPVVTEARRRTDLPAHQRFRMVRWSAAVTTGANLSRRFTPHTNIEDPDAQRAAIDALRTRVERCGDRRSIQQLVAIDGQLAVHDLLRLIDTDLSIGLAERATRPKRGNGVDPAAVLSVVGDVVERLDEAGIHAFLMSGTLLGFVREGGVLAHDHDVDLGLLPDVNVTDVGAALTGSGLQIVTGVDGHWIIAVHESGLHIDFFRHERRDGLFWHRTQIHEWWNTPFELAPLTVGGRRWWIPDDPKRYLDENYGDWSHPVAFYEISFDTPNRRYVDAPAAVRYLYSTCVRGLDSGNRWEVESAVRELRDSFGLDLTQNLASSPLLDERSL